MKQTRRMARKMPAGWSLALALDDYGRVSPSANNVEMALREDVALEGTLWMEVTEHVVWAIGLSPFDPNHGRWGLPTWKKLTDRDIDTIESYLQTEFRFPMIDRKVLYAVVLKVAKDQVFKIAANGKVTLVPPEDRP